MGANKQKSSEYVIKMVVRDDTDFLSPFSERRVPVISADVADYLESNTPASACKKQLRLQLISGCITDRELQSYRKATKEYYRDRYMDSHADIKKQYLIAAILALVGMVFLAVSLTIGDLWNGAFFGELVDIAAWVFVWEAVDVICFRKQELRVNRTRYQALMNMEIDLKKTGCADEEKVPG